MKRTMAERLARREERLAEALRAAEVALHQRIIERRQMAERNWSDLCDAVNRLNITEILYDSPRYVPPERGILRKGERRRMVHKGVR